jgi:hypothetical protein
VNMLDTKNLEAVGWLYVFFSGPRDGYESHIQTQRAESRRREYFMAKLCGSHKCRRRISSTSKRWARARDVDTYFIAIVPHV